MQIVVLDETSVAGVETGPGSPAYFSRHLIKHLRAKGHAVSIVGAFDEAEFAAADAVWSEWVTRGAYEAAASGVCKKLILRMRGFDVWSPLHTMVWTGVDALVYESLFIKQLVYERPIMHSFQLNDRIIPSGVDLAAFPFKERSHGNVIALVARATSDKGYQLAAEWAHQRQDLEIHVATALGETNPRLIRYLAKSAPHNFHVCDTVDTAVWLNKIDANYLLSASIWETLGYTIAEAMSMGIKPLIHYAPGVDANWPADLTWHSLRELNALIDDNTRYDSLRYRQIVEEEYSADEGTRKFIELLYAPSTRQVRPAGHAQRASVSRLISRAENAIVSGDLEDAASIVTKFREVASSGLSDERAGLALGLAAAYYNVSDLNNAKVWATRCLLDGPSAPAMCLLGDIAEEQNDLEDAVGWYSGAVALPEKISRYRGLVTFGANAWERVEELQKKLQPKLLPQEAPNRYLIIVPVRNGSKWINACLESISDQPGPFLCVVVDDDSTDGTTKAWTPHINKADPRFVYVAQGSRRWSLANIVHTIAEYGQIGDVVVIVDGDDRLSADGVLLRLDAAYIAGAWMTYGSFIDTKGHKWLGPYPHAVVQAGAFRKHTFQGSHLKTFKIELYNKIKLIDLEYDNGQIFRTAGDVALMLPMLEMACERAVYISETLYIYNMETPDADHVLDPEEQVRVRDLIYSRAPYKRLEKL